MLPQTIALSLKYPNETVKLVAVDENADTVLSMSDLVIYGSFLEEHTFPEILLNAMCLGKPIIAPELPMIKKYVGIYSLCSYSFTTMHAVFLEPSPSNVLPRRLR